MICPACKKQLGHVHAYSQCFQRVVVDEDGHTGNWSSPEVLEDTTFECPHCCEDISDEIKPT